METRKKVKQKEKKPAKKDLAAAIQESKEKESGLSKRGRIFEGFVTKKFHKRIVLEFERIIFVYKYERYYKKITRIHARLPEYMEKEINVGDLVRVQECRPLSKIIHHIVIGKVKSIQKPIQNKVTQKTEEVKK